MKKFFNHIEEYICVVTSVILVMLTFANVVSRYFIHASISFTEEVTCALFVLLCTMGAALAAKRGAHLGLSIVTDRLSKRKAELVAVFASIINCLFAFVILYTSIFMVKNQILNGAVTLSLQWPAWIYGSFLPIGMVFAIWRFAQEGVKHYRAYKQMKISNSNLLSADVQQS